MKSFRIAVAAGVLAVLSTPAVAQLGGNDGHDFIDAVQKRDGDKATQLIDEPSDDRRHQDDEGDTGLIIAIRASDRDWTGFLLNRGADPNLAGRWRRHAADHGRKGRVR